MQVREKVEKSRNAAFFQCLVFSEAKSRLAKAAGAEPSGEVRDQKLHTIVAQSTSRSQRQKHLMLGARLEVQMSKKCTPLWCEAHFEVKVWKADHVPTTVGRSTARHDTTRDKTTRQQQQQQQQQQQEQEGQQGHQQQQQQQQQQLQLLLQPQLQLHCATLHLRNTTQDHTALHYTTLHSIALRYTTLRYATLHYTIQLHNTTATKTTTTTTTTTATATAAIQRQLQYATPRYIQQLWVRWPLQPIQKDNSNHFLVLQWVRSAIHASQQLASPIVSFLWNFRHRLVRYYW